MRRTVFGILTVSLFALCLMIASVSAGEQKTVKSVSANLYSKPDKGSTVTDTLKKDEKVTVIEQEGDWYMVRLSDKRLGWMHKDIFGDTATAKKSPSPADETSEVASKKTKLPAESPKPAARKSEEKSSAVTKKIPPIADVEPPSEDKTEDETIAKIKETPEGAAKKAADEPEKMATLKVITGRVREDASQDAPIKFELKKGDTVSIIETKDGWYHLKTQDGRSGWSHQSLFSMDSGAKGAGFREVKDIRVGKTPEGDEKVTFVLNGFYPPKTFVLEEDTPKIVCDFAEARASERIKPVIPINGTYLQKIRVGIHEGKLRIVLDMIPNKNYSVQQTYFKKDNFYILTLKAGN